MSARFGAGVGHDGEVSARVVSWNLQGRERPDLVDAARWIEASAPDVVLLQEVQRGQAHRLAGMLGWEREWRFKHWPVVVPAEGLAILSPHRLSVVERRTLAKPWSVWSWRRRVAIAATVESPVPIRVVNTHLGAGVGDAERARQARLTAAMTGDGAALVGGDLNTHPGSAVLRAYEDAGLRDAWAEVRPAEPGHTNWEPGPRDRPPTQRLDYVLVNAAVTVCDAVVATDDADFGRFGALSDHLPLTVVVAVR